jgi:hypothetical protein
MLKVRLLNRDLGGFPLVPNEMEVFSFWPKEDAVEGRPWGISYQECKDVGFITSDERGLDNQEVISQILIYHEYEHAETVFFYREDFEDSFRVLLEQCRALFVIN